jgi:hypothetical protein
MAFGFYFGKDVLDFAVGADYECRPGDTHHFLPIHVFFLDDAIGFSDFLVGICQQGKGQLEFVLKFLLCFGSVRRDAKEDGAGFLNLLVGVAEGAGFDGASGSIGARIKIEHDDLAAQGLERDFPIVLVVQSELRSLIIDVDIHEHLAFKEIKVEGCGRRLGV